MKKRVADARRIIRRKENLRRLLFDFIAAFMGVLIAMGLSNWQQNRKEDAFIKKSVISIYKDNVDNIESMKAQVADLKIHIDTFGFYKNNESLTLIDVIRKNQYLKLQSLQFGGWEILERSNLIYKLNYEVASCLANLEDQSDIIKARRKGVTDMLYNSTYSTSCNDKKTIRVNLRGLLSASNIFLERALLVDSLLEASYKKYIVADMLDVK